ncbi:glycosyltransferase [Portibacter lacus]|nr:glycosyltransferase [Portibacter lacus]
MKFRELKVLKLVILSSRFPFPLEKGDKLRLYHQIQGLAKHHEIHLISLSDSDVSKADLDKMKECCETVTIFNCSRMSSALHASRSIFNTIPFQVNYFYSKKIRKQVQAHILKLNPDAIYCQLIRMAEYTKDLPYPKILDYMDAFSLNYSRRVKHESFLKKAFFKMESKRLQRYEVNIAGSFDKLTIISEQDSKSIITSKDITVISNGLNAEYFKPRTQDKPYDLLFVGNMGYHPNILAAKFIVNKIKPLLATETKLQIAGARPSGAVRAFASEHVEITGWVDDIRTAYASAKIFVAPIFSGAGQQNKILEAMSMGLICITTPTVNEAIGAENKKELFIATKPEEFAKLIKEILADPEAFKIIGLNARKFVKEHFSWAIENKKLNDVIINCRKEKENA